ncbi:slc44a4 [Symbiodinium pilosum]|uniref:Choline transporter-like protein n=1 Tax=Symbiodinium pilosum TaxID=2952 RepID=A0A812XWS9_SYMPI|nr:slc44a4 [Symbiodinium pilosum]
MGCCCNHEHAEIEEPLRIRANPGPPSRRRCTDLPCCVFFVVVLAGNAVLLDFFGQVGDLRRIDHGLDHDGNLCGLGSQATRPYAFYPDLDTDFAKDQTLRQRYGICLEACPAVGSSVQDYGNMRQSDWVVLQPSFAIFRRCVPYQQPADQSSTAMCASPSCEPIPGAPSKPEQVCGLKRDNTDKYWLLEQPDTSLEDGWRAEGADSALISARVAMSRTAASEATRCRQKLRREASTAIRPLNDSLAYNLLTSVTSADLSELSVDSGYALILGLGARVLETVVCLNCQGSVMLERLALLLVVFVVLILADYVLSFMRTALQKDWSSVAAALPSNADVVPACLVDSSPGWFAIGGCLLAVAIMLLACTASASASHGALIGEAVPDCYRVAQRGTGKCWRKHLVKHWCREHDPKSAFPAGIALVEVSFGNSVGEAIFSAVLILGLLGVATASDEQVAAMLDHWNVHANEAVRHFQQAAAAVFVVSFIWLYFFHVAVYHNTIALTVSRWYFRGDLQEHHLCPSLGGCLGGPVAISLLQAFRYHCGSLAFGALALTVCTIPRVLLEFLEKHAKETGEQNALAAAVRCATRCCLSWLHCCLQFVTEYAYMYVAVIGDPFCSCACKSFQLFSKYPAQVALNTLTSVVLGFLVCIGVPFALVLAAFGELRDSWVSFEPCALCVIVLAYIISRLSVGVYDAILTTLFICAMRDEEYCGGQHMSVELRQA